VLRGQKCSFMATRRWQGEQCGTQNQHRAHRPSRSGRQGHSCKMELHKCEPERVLERAAAAHVTTVILWLLHARARALRPCSVPVQRGGVKGNAECTRLATRKLRGAAPMSTTVEPGGSWAARCDSSCSAVKARRGSDCRRTAKQEAEAGQSSWQRSERRTSSSNMRQAIACTL
jgi:hypothetical protein